MSDPTTCPYATDDYIEPEHADHLRIAVDYEGLAVDAACSCGGYTEELWTEDFTTDINGAPITPDRALALAQDFARLYVPHLLGTRPKVALELLTDLHPAGQVPA